MMESDNKAMATPRAASCGQIDVAIFFFVFGVRPGLFRLWLFPGLLFAPLFMDRIQFVGAFHLVFEHIFVGGDILCLILLAAELAFFFEGLLPLHLGALYDDMGKGVNL